MLLELSLITNVFTMCQAFTSPEVSKHLRETTTDLGPSQITRKAEPVSWYKLCTIGSGQLQERSRVAVSLQAVTKFLEIPHSKRFLALISCLCV